MWMTLGPISLRYLQHTILPTLYPYNPGLLIFLETVVIGQRASAHLQILGFCSYSNLLFQHLNQFSNFGEQDMRERCIFSSFVSPQIWLTWSSKWLSVADNKENKWHTVSRLVFNNKLSLCHFPARKPQCLLTAYRMTCSPLQFLSNLIHQPLQSSVCHSYLSLSVFPMSIYSLKIAYPFTDAYTIPTCWALYEYIFEEDTSLLSSHTIPTTVCILPLGSDY